MADQIKAPVAKEDTLPSGKKVVFYRRKGIALVNAQRKAAGDSSRIPFALLSEVVEIDGQPVLMEDIEDMDLMDVIKLQEGFADLGKPGPTPPL